MKHEGEEKLKGFFFREVLKDCRVCGYAQAINCIKITLYAKGEKK